MTLRELRKVVKIAEGKKTPKAGTIEKSGAQIIVKEVINADTEISVYDNGYVVYRSGKRSSTFPLHQCNGYKYGSVHASSTVFKSDFFENENWYIRLILEGEDRIAENIELSHLKHCVSYSRISEEWNELVDEKLDIEKEVLDKIEVDELLRSVDKDSAFAIEKYYKDDMTQKEIAKELNTYDQAVNRMIRKNVMRIRKAVGIESKK